VLVNSVCGQVPQRKLRQTFSSDQTKLTVAIPIASGPIICWEKESRQSKWNKDDTPWHLRTSNNLRCISASRPIFAESFCCERFE
jgi:hypothetical protein